MVGRVEKLETRKYLRIIAAIAVVGIAAVVYAYYKHTQYEKLEVQAQDFFYQMKVFELGLSRLESRLIVNGDSSAKGEVERSREKLKELNASYDKYVDDLGIYKEGMDEKTRTIYHVARVFGECEVNMPDEFIGEVEKYIHEWRLSDRLSSSLQRAKDRKYTGMIANAMLEQHLPPQFMYLALQESGFDSTLCGPPTRFGIAKGMWQFIPSTAQHYGLRTGPLIELPRRDPRDERHRVEKSTLAAAKYLRDIYETEAQASGLLVLASYNWGHNLVKGLIRELPENPRERNFWAFLTTYKSRIPKQTYDYVYLIFSAAVIGENPQLFGFNFDKPIASQAL
jgi:membrane-bound lytic murein transglycosylase D